MPELDDFSKEEKKNMEVFMVQTVRKFKDLTIYAKRIFLYNRVEIVVFTKDLESWIGVMKEIYGDVRKHANIRPSKEDNDLTSAYGGVNDTQVLFSKNISEGITSFAMFWPWNDDEHMTVHMSFSKNIGGVGV